MPTLSPADLRTRLASGDLAPLYLILGDDEAEKGELAAAFARVIEEDLAAFNVERLYAGEGKVTARVLIDAARTLPMMAPRRIVIVLRAERMLSPKPRKDAERRVESNGIDETERELEKLASYIEAPEPHACLVFVARAVDKRRRAVKLLLQRAVVVPCGILENAAEAADWLRQKLAERGLQIEQPALRLVIERVGADVGRLRGFVENVALYATGRKRIGLGDVQEVLGAPESQDDFAVTKAIEQGAVGRALQELALLLDGGTPPYLVLGQLGWFVRTKFPALRVQKAVEALFRTDLELKSSGGDPRVLLERLVVELCEPGGLGGPGPAERSWRRPVSGGR